MVITTRPTSNVNAAEMMRMQKRKQAARSSSMKTAAAAATTTTTTRKAHAPLPLPPPLHRLHNTTAANKVVAVVGTDTPPLAFSLGKSCRRPRKNNQQAQSHQQQQQQYQHHAPIVSWGGKRNQSAATTVIPAAAPTSAVAAGGGRVVRGVDEDEPLPWPPTMSPLHHLQPRPLHSPQNQLQLPNPSFGDEDFGILAGCIENLDSMGSIDDNSVVVIDSVRQGGNCGEGASSNATTAASADGDRKYSSCVSSEKVVAATRAAAAVLAGNKDYGIATPMTDVASVSRSILPRPGKNTTTPCDDVVILTSLETKTTPPPPSMTATNEFMRRSHSSESIVVTSPSRNGDSNCSRSTVSHPPSSPETFLLMTPAGGIPGDGTSSPTSHHLHENHSMHVYETSPTSLYWDELSNMDQFFNDVTGGGTTTPTASPRGDGGGGGDSGAGQSNDGVDSRQIGSGNVGAAGGECDASAGNYIHFSPVKRKCDVLYGRQSPPLVDDGNREQKQLKTQRQNQQQHHGQKDEFSHLASNSSSPSSLRIMKSDSKMTEKKAKNLKKSKDRDKSPVKSAKLVTPRNQIFSLKPSSSYPPPPPSAPIPLQPQLFQGNETEVESSNGNLYDDPIHPSNATLKKYDNELYHKLRNTQPPRDMTLPPRVVPSNLTGNQLVILQGSSKQHEHYRIEECVFHSTYSFYNFLREIYPALEGCTYLLPGLHQRRTAANQYSSRCEEDVGGIDMRSRIHVSSFGSFALTRSDKSKLTDAGVKMAKQRVECAIYAFGGTVTRRQSSPSQPSKPDKMSIFRVKKDSTSTTTTKTSLAKSSSQSGSGEVCDADGSTSRSNNKQRSSSSRSISRQRKYEEKLRQQYFEHGDRLSWDVQANLSLTLDGGNTFDEEDILLQWSGGSNLSDGKQQHQSQQQPKKNRCKKCGQIKQGHVCPYSSSMQRSIGVMVYPSVNAHVADEPGYLAPALCEMNNFISIKGSASFESNNGDDRMKLTSLIASSERTSGVQTSASCGKDDAAKAMNPYRRKSLLASPTRTSEPIDNNKRAPDVEGVAKLGKSKTESTNLLFQPTMEVTIDQYRTITSSKDALNSHDHDLGYVYPQVPLTFTQRKSLSDALFSLSKRVPKLTEECALVLAEARKNDQWDLAVAELMAQVLCVLHCSPTNDFILEGLRRYLLTLGVVC